MFRAVDWVSAQGARMHCPCGPQQGWGPTGRGYACDACARRLPAALLLRHPIVPMRCCWCGDRADTKTGYLILGHPPLEEPERPPRAFGCAAER